jgi:pimeloyl-ACP methyl ester carboxylesterase
MPTIKANEVELNYLQLGDGPDLVMVHGLAASLAYWYLRIAPALAECFRVTMYDLRGHGLSEMPPAGYTTDVMAADLAGLMNALGIERAHLVGHSFGGAVALHFAMAHPVRAETLSLLDCRVNSLQPIRGLDELDHWESRRQSLLAAGIPVPEGTPRIVYAMLEELVPDGGLTSPQPEGVPGSQGLPGLIAGNGAWNPNSRAGKRWSKLVASTSFADDMKAVVGLTPERIAGVHKPTLLSYGADSGCLRTCRGLESLWPHSHVSVHPELGHFFPSVRPDLVVADVLGFLAPRARQTTAAATQPSLARGGSETDE